MRVSDLRLDLSQGALYHWWWTWKISYCAISCKWLSNVLFWTFFIEIYLVLWALNLDTLFHLNVDSTTTKLNYLYLSFMLNPVEPNEHWHYLILWETFCKYCLSEINKFKLKDLSEVTSWNATNVATVIWSKVQRFAHFFK